MLVMILLVCLGNCPAPKGKSLPHQLWLILFHTLVLIALAAFFLIVKFLPFEVWFPTLLIGDIGSSWLGMPLEYCWVIPSSFWPRAWPLHLFHGNIISPTLFAEKEKGFEIYATSRWHQTGPIYTQQVAPGFISQQQHRGSLWSIFGTANSIEQRKQLVMNRNKMVSRFPARQTQCSPRFHGSVLKYACYAPAGSNFGYKKL